MDEILVSAGQIKIFCGPHLARGPYVVHPCVKLLSTPGALGILLSNTLGVSTCRIRNFCSSLNTSSSLSKLFHNSCLANLIIIILYQKSPVTFLRSASALDRLLVLCDATLYVINASDLSLLNLSGSSKFKGVIACCVNENPNMDDPFSVQVRFDSTNYIK